MTRTIAETLAMMTETLDAHTPKDQDAILAFLKAYYPKGGLDTAQQQPAEAQTRERDRTGRQRQARYREHQQADRETLRDALRDTPLRDVTNGSAPPPDVRSSSSASSNTGKASKPKKQLDNNGLEKAKAVLVQADFDFLSSCPEPFKTHWLIDAEWWVSLRDGYPKVDAQREASKCMSYVQGKFTVPQLERLNLRERLRKWFATADRWREEGERRREQRR